MVHYKSCKKVILITNKFNFILIQIKRNKSDRWVVKRLEHVYVELVNQSKNV